MSQSLKVSKTANRQPLTVRLDPESKKLFAEEAEKCGLEAGVVGGELVEAIEDPALASRVVLVIAGDHGERYEVLLRMRDTEGRTLLPEQFLGAATRLGLDRLLDRWVVSRALRGLDARQQDHPGTVFFVKLGTASVADPSFPEWLRQMLGKGRVVHPPILPAHDQHDTVGAEGLERLDRRERTR